MPENFTHKKVLVKICSLNFTYVKLKLTITEKYLYKINMETRHE